MYALVGALVKHVFNAKESKQDCKSAEECLANRLHKFLILYAFDEPIKSELSCS